MICNGLLFGFPSSLTTTAQNDVISKLCTCGISLAIYLSLCKLLPVDRSIDSDFVNSTPFYLQVVYLYLAMLALRPKYYFVWTFGECCIAAKTFLHATQGKKISTLSTLLSSLANDHHRMNILLHLLEIFFLLTHPTVLGQAFCTTLGNHQKQLSSCLTRFPA